MSNPPPAKKKRLSNGKPKPQLSMPSPHTPTLTLQAAPIPSTSGIPKRTTPSYQSVFLISDPKNTSTCSTFNNSGSLAAFGTENYVKILHPPSAHVFYPNRKIQKRNDPPIINSCYGHTSHITSVSFHPLLPDSVLLSTDTSGVVNFYDLRRFSSSSAPKNYDSPARQEFWGTPVNPFANFQDTHSILSSDFHPGGLCVGLGTKSSVPRIYNIQNFSAYVPQNLSQKGSKKGHTNSITDLKFSSNGDTLVTCSSDGSVIIWDASTLTPKTKIENAHGPAHRKSSVWSVDLSDNGKFCLSFGADMKGHLWSVNSGSLLRSYVLDSPKAGPGFRANAVFQFDENYIFLPNGTAIEAFDTRKTICSFDLLDHTFPITSLSASPATASILSTSIDSSVRYWEDRDLQLGPVLP